jgi:S-adenosylmethionine hydrolase
MAIVTLTTDMGLKDHYVAAVKGAILTQCPGTIIVDVSHLVKPFDIAEAAFVLRQAWPEFPKGTIHIIGVNPEADGRTPHLVVRHDDHYFIAADNGVFSLLFDGRPHEAFEITMKLDDDHAAFTTKTVFGRKVAQTRELIGFQPTSDATSIRGKVVHVDTYGNLVTNVRKQLFNEVGKGRTFRIGFGRSEDDITKLHTTYADVPMGERVAFFGSSGLLEIAVNKGVEGSGGGASRLFGVGVSSPVRIEFMEWSRN